MFGRRTVIALGAVAGFMAGYLALAPRSEVSLPAGARWLEYGAEHWQRQGFVEVVPSIPLPVARPGVDWTRIYLKLPETGVIELVRRGEHRGLKLPLGSIADRVEYRAGRDGPIVADVRGTELSGSGEVFRAFRPWRASPRAPLVGYTWPRVEGDAPREVRSGFDELLRTGHAVARPPTNLSATRARFERILDCSSCHQAFRPERRDAPGTQLKRGTDAQAFFTLEYALKDTAPLESYRAHDPSFAEPFVRRYCGEALQPPEPTTEARCPNGEVPMLRLDVAAGRAADDPHTLAVCASRARLHARMSPEARRFFRAGLEGCGLTAF